MLYTHVWMPVKINLFISINFIIIASSQPYGSEVSSDAFQKFLSERAAAADTLPSVPTVSAATGSAAPPPLNPTQAPTHQPWAIGAGTEFKNYIFYFIFSLFPSRSSIIIVSLDLTALVRTCNCFIERENYVILLPNCNGK